MRPPREVDTATLRRTAGYLLRNCRWRARQKGLACTLTREWIERQLRRGHCSVTKVAFKLGSSRPTPFSASVDRIEPRLGYTPENSRVVSYAFNVLRAAGSDAEAKRWLRRAVAAQLAR
jgi:hypothetical protein